MKMAQWWIRPGNGGWCRFNYDESPVLVFMRFMDTGGRLAPVEEYLRRNDGEPLSNANMIDVPRSRLVKHANAPHVAGLLRGWMELQSVDMATASQFIQVTIGRDTAAFDDHWVTRMLRYKFEDDPPLAPPPPEDDPKGRVVAPTAPIDATLDIPQKRPYPDSFYWQVLDMADTLEAAGQPACKVMAEVNGVPHARVRQWRSEGRRRRNRRVDNNERRLG